MSEVLYLAEPYIASFLGETVDVRFPPGNPELAELVEASAELPNDSNLKAAIEAEKPAALARTWGSVEGLFPGKYVIKTPPVLRVSMAQARRALHRAGLLDAVAPTIAAIPDPNDRMDAEILWEYSTSVDRNDLLVLSLAETFKLTNEQMDNLFVLASGL